MDPATIIGTTSAIISFISFAGSVISTAVEIRKSVHGATEDNQGFEEAVLEFQQNLQELRASTGKSAGLPQTRGRPEHDAKIRHLLRVAGDCEKLGAKISILMEKTKAKAPAMVSNKPKHRQFISRISPFKLTGGAASPSKPTMIEAIRASVHTIWNQRDVEALRQEWRMCIMEFNNAQSRYVQSKDDVRTLFQAF